MKMEQSVPKRRHIKFRRQGINYPEESIQHSINWFAISANLGMGKELVKDMVRACCDKLTTLLSLYVQLPDCSKNLFHLHYMRLLHQQR
jgi:hypothetical protein